MAGILDAGKTKVTDLVEQSRAIFLADTPIFYILGYIVALYLTFYVITFYIGPAIFGRRPYWRRSMDLNEMNPLIVNPVDPAKLTEQVHSALEKHSSM